MHILQFHRPTYTIIIDNSSNLQFQSLQIRLQDEKRTLLVTSVSTTLWRSMAVVQCQFPGI